MVEWYGTRIQEQYGIEPPTDWCKAVDQADDTTVQRGLSLIKSRYLDHPPTLPQFEQVMRPQESGGTRGPTEQVQLCDYVMKTRGASFTAKQIRSAWTYCRDRNGELVAIVPEDGSNPSVAVSALEMRSGQQSLA